MENSIENSVVEKPTRHVFRFTNKKIAQSGTQCSRFLQTRQYPRQGTSAVTEQYPQAREPLSDGVCEQRCGGKRGLKRKRGRRFDFSSRWSAKTVSSSDPIILSRSSRIGRPSSRREQLGMTAGAFAANTARLLHHISQLRNLLYSSEPMLATGRRTGG